MTTHDQLRFTAHGTQRFRQRGYRKDDLGLLLEAGTPTGPAERSQTWTS